MENLIPRITEHLKKRAYINDTINRYVISVISHLYSPNNISMNLTTYKPDTERWKFGNYTIFKFFIEYSFKFLT